VASSLDDQEDGEEEEEKEEEVRIAVWRLIVRPNAALSSSLAVRALVRLGRRTCSGSPHFEDPLPRSPEQPPPFVKPTRLQVGAASNAGGEDTKRSSDSIAATFEELGIGRWLAGQCRVSGQFQPPVLTTQSFVSCARCEIRMRAWVDTIATCHSLH
jgi:hypothetical protein